MGRRERQRSISELELGHRKRERQREDELMEQLAAEGICKLKGENRDDSGLG